MKKILLPFLDDLESALENPATADFIQAILGPRQVGKTTGVLQLLKKIPDHHYASADGELPRAPEWLFEQWQLALAKGKSGLLVIDEIQKVERWSETLKAMWDAQKRQKDRLKVIILGSSSLTLQQGLSESLAGRFRLHKVFHWSPEESLAGYRLSLEEFLRFGGYPGSYPLISDLKTWLSYVRESIVEAVIAKDILSQARVKSPALFKQCFELVCSYPAQEISYTKLLGQLQDRGNVELVKYYLQLFEGAFLIRQLYKFSAKKTLTKSSSPKILPLCPALFSIGIDADLNEEDRGRAFEVTIGSLLNRLPGQLYYWREGNAEVDYVYQFGKKLFAIEVKSGRKKSAKGLMKFQSRHPAAKALIVTPENYRSTLEELNL